MPDRYFIDLFAGCGGLSLGLEEAGFTPLLVNEISPHALATYLVNRDKRFPHLREAYSVPNIFDLVANGFGFLRERKQDIQRDFSLNIDNGDLDLVVGGPPCQGFSGLGHRRTFKVNRREIPSNYLFAVMVEAIRFLRPKMFLFENVRGIRSATWTSSGVSGEVWSDVIAAFGSLHDYTILEDVVFAKDFGVPQRRPRVLIAGVRRDLVATQEATEHLGGLIPKTSFPAPDLEDILGDLIDPNYRNGGITPCYPQAATNAIQIELRTNPATNCVSATGDLVSEHEYSHHSASVVERFAYMLENGGGLPSGYTSRKFSQRLLPKRWGTTGPTITAASMPDDYVHFQQPRSLTVREWARLQTFPDWYQFCGPRTTGGAKRAGTPKNQFLDRELPKYTQIGNAVPVAMARRLGNHFRSILDCLHA